jgi:tetratricopeptide (TPR) repeat protein
VSDVETQRLSLARHYSDIGQPRRVLEMLDSGVELDDPEAWALRSEALYQVDRYTEGVEAARRGLALEPDDATLLDALALNLIELDDLAGAELALLAALEQWPDDPALLCHYGLACARGSDVQKARALVDRAARVAPDSIDVLRARAQVAWLTRDKRALEYADEVLALDPDDRIAHMVRGNVLVERSDVHRAVRHFEHATRLDPTDTDTADVTRHNRAVTHWSQWPIYPINRFGPFKVWAAYLVLVAAVSATGVWAVAAPLIILYLFMVVYSWTIAPLARQWLQRRR